MIKLFNNVGAPYEENKFSSYLDDCIRLINNAGFNAIDVSGDFFILDNLLKAAKEIDIAFILRAEYAKSFPECIMKAHRRYANNKRVRGWNLFDEPKPIDWGDVEISSVDSHKSSEKPDPIYLGIFIFPILLL